MTASRAGRRAAGVPPRTFAKKWIDILPIRGLDNLTRADARAVEQVLIQEAGGIGTKGLLNKINSIAAGNPIYASSIIRGCALLLLANYPAPKTCS
jgi:filamentous hemagglutinin